MIPENRTGYAEIHRFCSVRSINEIENKVDSHNEIMTTAIYKHNDNKEAADADGIEVHAIWLPDGVVFTICSFMCHKEISDAQSTFQAGLLLPRFFHDLGRTSKSFHALLHRYFRQTPLNLNLSQRVKHNYEKIEWVCHNEVKLGHCHLYVRGQNEAAVCKYIVSSCNLIELESCKIHLVKDRCDVQESEASDAGIPCEGSHKQNNNFMEEFQLMFANYVPTRAMSLRSLALTLKGNYCPPLLGAFSNSLEHLELTIFAPEQSPNPITLNKELCALSQSLKKLPKLKTLKITAKYAASFTIKSDTLELIDTTGSKGFYINYCVCPRLKSFICDYKLFHYSKPWSNGVKPLVPFRDEDISEMCVGGNVLEATTSQHPFAGFFVPNYCTVRMKTI